jgi:hypothetical protein
MNARFRRYPLLHLLRAVFGTNLPVSVTDLGPSAIGGGVSGAHAEFVHVSFLPLTLIRSGLSTPAKSFLHRVQRICGDAGFKKSVRSCSFRAAQLPNPQELGAGILRREVANQLVVFL